jgi:hypothetical protein
MAALTVAAPVTYGGRFLFTIQKKNNGQIYSVLVNGSNDLCKTAVIAFDTREKATALAYTIEEHNCNYPIEVDSPDFTFNLSGRVLQPPLADLYIQKWDSYHLHNFVTQRNLDLIVSGMNGHRLYEAPSDPSNYIDYYNAIISKY